MPTLKYSKEFEEFWKAYPRKVGKGGAYRIWLRIKPNKELVQIILSAIEKQKYQDQWADLRYVPHPSTWLNQERWEDEVEEGGKIDSFPER